MDKITSSKAEFPAAYAADGLFPPQRSKARRISAVVIKSALAVVFAGLALALIYQLVHGECPLVVIYSISSQAC